MLECFDNKEPCSLELVEENLNIICADQWKNDVKSFPKLRTYVMFKKDFEVEKYLSCHLTRRERSLFAQFRMGILPLRLETGRYRNEKVNDRICMLCNRNEIEDEKHFIFQCPLYTEEREILYNKINRKCPEFERLDMNEQLYITMTDFVIPTSKYINEAFMKRRQTLYK